MKTIQFQEVSKAYGYNQVVQDLNLTIQAGERLVLLGPSGSGKSTILRMIAGLESISSGSLYFDQQLMNPIPPGKRNIAMVFQSYALFPHMSVEKNIQYALKAAKVGAQEAAERTAEAIKMLSLQNLENRKPREISGGQRQRVALARAIVKRSDIFLLDEPLSNLDAQLRVKARKELIRLHDYYQQTLVYVTHDQIEATTLGHRIALLHQGKLQMIGTPYELYHEPANVFTATFIGSPATNIIEVQFDGQSLRLNDQVLDLDAKWLAHLSARGPQKYVLGVRPEDITLQVEDPDQRLIPVEVQSSESYGGQYGVNFTLLGEDWICTTKELRCPNGSTAFMNFDSQKMNLFDFESRNNIGSPYHKQDAQPLAASTTP